MAVRKTRKPRKHNRHKRTQKRRVISRKNRGKANSIAKIRKRTIRRKRGGDLKGKKRIG